VISQDGRYVAFQSDADDLVPNDTNQVPDVFLRDLVEKTTTLISAGPTGAVGNSTSLRPWMNATGDTILFTSAASNLVPGDYNENTDVFIVQLAAPSLQKALLQQGKLNLQFSTRAQRKYRIESATDVAAGPWTVVQELTATGASTSVSLPASGAREFYRITLEP
jgi:hypothetical protein